MGGRGLNNILNKLEKVFVCNQNGVTNLKSNICGLKHETKSKLINNNIQWIILDQQYVPSFLSGWAKYSIRSSRHLRTSERVILDQATPVRPSVFSDSRRLQVHHLYTSVAELCFIRASRLLIFISARDQYLPVESMEDGLTFADDPGWPGLFLLSSREGEPIIHVSLYKHYCLKKTNNRSI